MILIIVIVLVWFLLSLENYHNMKLKDAIHLPDSFDNLISLGDSNLVFEERQSFIKDIWYLTLWVWKPKKNSVSETLSALV